MKVLVIDDKAVNRMSAEQTIIGHDLTVADGWDQAMELMEVCYGDQAIQDKLIARGLPPTHGALRDTLTKPQMTDEEGKIWKEWWKTYYEVREDSKLPYWDVVLTDLMMPASKETMGPEGKKFVGQEMPLGLVIALLAAKNGAKYVAIMSATNHHNHPIVAALDRLQSQDEKPNLDLNGAKFLFGVCYAHYVDGLVCEKCNGVAPKGCWECNQTGKARGKDWGQTLAQLLGKEAKSKAE